MASTLPRPRSIRLSPPANGARAPAPPFGLRAWTEDASAQAVAVQLDLPGDYDIADVARQVPDPDGFGARTLVVVLGEAAGGGSRLLSRLFGGRRPRVERAVRASALLARGYVDLGGGVDDGSGQDLAWGYSRRDVRLGT
jgi:hypothetical protein